MEDGGNLSKCHFCYVVKNRGDILFTAPFFFFSGGFYFVWGNLKSCPAFAPVVLSVGISATNLSTPGNKGCLPRSTQDING